MSCAPGPTRVIPFDLAQQIGVEYQATSPNLLASYIRILKGESIETAARATSQAFYIIRGSGSSTSPEHGKVECCNIGNQCREEIQS